MSDKKRNTQITERMKTLRMIRTSAIIRNPLLLEAIGLCPVVAIATSFKTALFLALITALELIACELLASRFLKKVKRFVRVAVYFIVGTAIVFPIMTLVSKFLPGISLEFGVFLPLIAVNSLLALHCERVAVKRTVKDSLIDAVSVSVSYGIVTVAAGTVREIVGSGTFFGKDIKLPVTFPIMLAPFGGLLVLGFSAALLKLLIYKKHPQTSPDRAFNTSEVRSSLKGSLRELMNDDYNPYDEGDDASGTSGSDNDDLYIRHGTKQKRQKVKEVNKPKKEKTEKKKKPKKEKLEKAEKINQNEAEKREIRAEKDVERTYLDDFSDILSELEDYKSSGSDNSGESEGGE